MRVRVESAEVQTLMPNGKHWDGWGRPVPEVELPQFFQLDIGAQLDRIVVKGHAPNPPDVMVRIFVKGKKVLETDAEESFDPIWPADGPEADLDAGTEVRIEVYDQDFIFHDHIGTTTVSVPERPTDGRWTLGPFGQVRWLVLLLD